jgi:hypothetical protein
MTEQVHRKICADRGAGLANQFVQIVDDSLPTSYTHDGPIRACRGEAMAPMINGNDRVPHIVERTGKSVVATGMFRSAMGDGDNRRR